MFRGRSAIFEAAGASRGILARRTCIALGLACCTIGLVAGAAIEHGRPAGSSPRFAGHGLKNGHGLRALSPTVQSALSAAVGKASTTFTARETADGYRLKGGGVTADLGARNVTLRAPDGDLSFALAGLGRGSTLDVPAGARLGAHANRVTLERDGVMEWYAAGPLGIEQGFTLSQRPSGATDPVRLALRLGGDARAHRDAAGKVFLTRPGGQRLSYGALSAIDARGRSLPASLHVRGQVLEIRVEDRGAAYPLVIDPLIQQGLKITPGGAIGVAGLGFEVALSADGNTALVGGPFDNSDVGAAWVFTRTGVTWTQQAKLTGGNEIGTASFGGTVALSADGNTALVGGLGDNNGLGAAWVFTRSSAIWGQQAKLTPGGASGTPFFGYNLALSADGNTALIGGPADTSDRGAAWVFVRSGPNWSQQGGKLVPSGATDPSVGFAVALSADGNTALLAGPYDNNAVGAAWVFTRSVTTWTQQGGKLTGTGEVGAGFFGISVALTADGNTALVGASDDNNFVGSAFTFVRSGGSWSQQGGKIAGVSESGQAQFGWDVALAGDGTSALVGGPADNSDAGASWQFLRNGTGWLQQGKLAGGGEIGAGGFGTAVALSSNGGTGLSGGPYDNNEVGAVWAFITAAPFGPAGVSATAGTGQATVSFTPPLGPVSSYTVSASPGLASATGTGSPIVVNGLVNGVSYTFTVTATNAGGTGPASSPSNAVTPFGLAGAPTAVSATAGDGYAVITFTPPASNGGAAILWYTATSSGGQSASSSSSPVVLYGLTNGQSYTFTVTATNSAGTGPASTASASVTPTGGAREHPAPPSPTPRPDVPTPPNGPRIPPPPG